MDELPGGQVRLRALAAAGLKQGLSALSMLRVSWASLSALTVGVLALTAATTASRGAGADLSVRITSPLGRTGGIGAVRIVAQIQQPSSATLNPVRFYVDGTLFKTDDDGPPYAVEWTDENPFERRELAVEVDDSEGRKGRDKVVLEAFEITEISEVASVLLEAGVYDRKGRFVSGLTRDQLRRQGRWRGAGHRPRQPRARPGHVRAAHRQQPEHVAPLRLREGCRRAADGLPQAEGHRRRRARSRSVSAR